jgi:hypothetical protein
LVAFRPTELRHQDTNFIAAKALHIINSWEAELTLIDDTGHWGHGVVDNLLAAGVNCIPINFADTKVHQPQYFNRRSEMWFEMAEWVKRGGCLPNIPELIPELTAPTYFFQNGKVRLIEKDQIKETLGRSPDLADALATTFAIPDQPGGFTVEEALASPRLRTGYGNRELVADYDPFDPRRANW